MMTCIEVRERLAAFVALDLDPRDEEALREHLSACPTCQQVLGDREPSFHLVWPLAATVGEEDEVFSEVAHGQGLSNGAGGTVLRAGGSTLVPDPVSELCRGAG